MSPTEINTAVAVTALLRRCANCRIPAAQTHRDADDNHGWQRLGRGDGMKRVSSLSSLRGGKWKRKLLLSEPDTSDYPQR
jgi:hypothetical protein